MSLLTPTSVAVIGASADEKKVGHLILKNLVTQGFKGSVHPVNPKGGEILGLPVSRTVSEIAGPVDVAVIVTPAIGVCALAEECGKKEVKTLVVISAGFGEIGTAEGHSMEEQLREIVKKHGMQLIGPNCLGVLRPSIGLNASFAKNLDKPGHVALLSQSGALGVALMDGATEAGLAFSLFVSMGNKASMDECDYLEICEKDPETKVIGIYVESIKNGQRFLEVASRVTAAKPVILIKSGVSQRGQKAVSSHTGALAGSDASVEALCTQSGVVRAHTAAEFLNLLRVHSMEPPLLSRRIAVVTNAGGLGVLATDAAEAAGLELVSLTPANEQALAAQLPPSASAKNPIDVLGDALADRYAAALTACAKDPNIDGVAVMLTPQVMTPVREVAQTIVDSMRKHPLMPVTVCFMGHDSIRDGVILLHDHAIPCFATPEEAVHALAGLVHRRVADTPTPPPANGKERREKALTLLKNQSGLLSEELVKELLTLYGLPTPWQQLAATEADALAIAKDLRFPVVAKISSPDIAHKTDAGGVRANLRSTDDVKNAYAEILRNVQAVHPKAVIRGVLLQEFLPPGNEFIVGAIRENGVGHLVLAGLGGIYTELFRDTAFRIAPVNERQSYDMLQELTSWKLLLGMRGKPMSDIAALADVIQTISHLVTDCPQIKELDLNPVLVDDKRVTILDAKVVMEG